MRRLTFLVGILAVGLLATPLLADVSLQSILINANGTQYINENTVPGANTAGWDGTTGTGTLQFIFNPGAAGTYNFGVFFDHQLSLPFFNEFGTVNGAPAAGQTYEIGDSFNSNVYPDVQAGGALPNTNTLPGTTSNFANNCAGANCNGDFAAAMAFNFTLAADEQADITFNISPTNPGGFSLEDTHPVDAANRTAVNLFISGSIMIEPAGTIVTTPEPSSLLLLGGIAGLLAAARRRRGGRPSGDGPVQSTTEH